jgi:DNA-binding NtrC family response regulator
MFTMKPKGTLLIADRNRNVRAFLRREFGLQGYDVVLAGDYRELLRAMTDAPRADLLILDPDIPSAAGEKLLDKVRELRPDMPIIIHSLTLEQWPAAAASAFLEKKGNNVESLKSVVFELLESIKLEGASVHAIRTDLTAQHDAK